MWALFFNSCCKNAFEGGENVKRRDFLRGASIGMAAAGVPFQALAAPDEERLGTADAGESSRGLPQHPRDYRKTSFKRLVILGESHVQGGPWLLDPKEERYPDVLVRLINSCQKDPVEYYNQGIGNNVISPRSPGYAQSRKPSALERYRKDVIDLQPDLFILAYGLNDMRAGMPLPDFTEDMATIIRDVQKACSPVTVLTTVYHMTGFRSWPPIDKGSEALTLRYNEAIKGLAAQYDCILADVWSAERLADWLMFYDGVHANKVGQMLIGNRVFEAIAQHASGLTNWTLEQGKNTPWAESTRRARAKVGDPYVKSW